MKREKVPAYQQIYNELFEEIRSQKYKQGELLPTEKSLAEEYHVSVITSKAVLNMLERNGYAKRVAGKGTFVDISVRSRKPKQVLIGFVTNGLFPAFGLDMFTALETAARERGFHLVPKFSYDRREYEEQALQSLLDLGVDGILDSTTHAEDIGPTLLKILLGHVPVVMMDRLLKGIHAPYVGTNNFKAAQEATNYLLELGHRCISFVSRPYHNSTVLEDRMSGFVRGFADHGTPIDESCWITDVDAGPLGEMAGKRGVIERIKRLLKDRPDITCFFATESEFGQLVYRAVTELGLRVPEDISILIFDGARDYLDDTFFTYIHQQENMIALNAVDLLLDQIQHHVNNGDTKIQLDASLVIGRSTGPYRA